MTKGTPCKTLAFVFCPSDLTVHRVYTGTGGYEDKQYGGGSSSRSRGGGVQVADQSFEHSHNNALVVSSCNSTGRTDLTISQISSKHGTPVRVIRGHLLNSKYSPYEGWVISNGSSEVASSHSPRYRYDGLYRVKKVIIIFLLSRQGVPDHEDRPRWANLGTATISAASRWRYGPHT